MLNRLKKSRLDDYQTSLDEVLTKIHSIKKEEVSAHPALIVPPAHRCAFFAPHYEPCYDPLVVKLNKEKET